jgi:hypothetical protein
MVKMYLNKTLKCETSTVTACALLVMMVISGSAQAAPPIDLAVNGDFETGDFTGWTLVNTGSGGININDGSFVPAGPGSPLPPIAGNFDAVTYQSGPGFHAFRQTINIPNNVFSASLTWNDRVRNHAGVFSDPNQEWRVLILDTSSGTLIQEVFSTTLGDTAIQVGPNSRSGDLTSILQAYAGQTVDISFEEQDNLGFFNATLDDVTLLASTLPTSKDECKKDGWETFVNVNTGVQIFKNQGDCVSFVATQGKNPPANYEG